MAKSLKDNVTKQTSKEDKKFLEKYGDKLSKSTQYAQWINSPKEHEEHPGKSLATRNHEVIKQWAEARGAKPSTVEGTQEHDGHVSVLRFDFPGYDSAGLLEISWDEFFKTFDDRDLVFIFQEHMKDGKESNFFRLDNPHREDA